MKTGFHRQTVLWLVLLLFGFSLTGKAFACSDPSAMEMGQGREADCCAERCRMETTHEDAKKACESSRTAFSTRDSLFSPKSDCAQSPAWMLSVPDTRSLFYPPLVEPDEGAFRLSSDPPLFRHHATVPIYTANSVFLI